MERITCPRGRRSIIQDSVFLLVFLLVYHNQWSSIYNLQGKTSRYRGNTSWYQGKLFLASGQNFLASKEYLEPK